MHIQTDTYHGVIGGVAVIIPLQVPVQLVNFDLWVMMAATLMILAYLAVGARLWWREGVLFLTAYGAYIAAQAVGVETVLGWIS